MLLGPLFSLLIICTVLFSCDASTLHKRGKKSMKQSKPSSLDDDDAFLDSQIKLNDIRTHYDVTLLDPAIYLNTLKKAHEFARASFDGLSLEQESAFDINTIKEFVSHIDHNKLGGSIDAQSQIMQADMTIILGIRKATTIRTAYFLYMTALENLIRYAQPHPLAYELIVNVFVDLDYTRLFEGLSNLGAKKLIESYLSGKGKDEKVTFSKSQCARFDLPGCTSNLILLLDNHSAVVKIVPNSLSFDKDLQVAVNNSIILLGAHIESEDGMFDSSAEIIAKFSLYKLLTPLIKDNERFIEQLSGLKSAQPAYMLSKTPTIEALEKVLSSLYTSMRMTYMSDHNFYGQRFQEQNIYSTRAVLVAVDIVAELQRQIHTFMDNFKFMLAVLHEPLFITNSPVFNKRAKKQVFTPNQFTRKEAPDFSKNLMLNHSSINTTLFPARKFSLDLEDIFSDSALAASATLEPKMFATLKVLVFGKKFTDLADLNWPDVAELVVALGGTVEVIAGAIKIIFIPGHKGNPVRFEQPHPDMRLGYAKGIAMRAIFVSFGFGCVE